MMHKMQIGRREQCLLEPRTCRRGLTQFVDGAVKGIVVVGGEVNLTQQTQATRVGFACHATEQREDQLGVAVLAAAMKRVGQVQLDRSANIGARLIYQAAIFIGSVGVAVPAHQPVGPGFDLSESWRRDR